MARVLGLGDAGVDIIMHVPRLPQHDEKILSTKVERHPGGVIANFLCALNRLGTPSSFLGCIGNDELGSVVRKRLEGFNIDLSRLIVKEGEETYFCVTMLDTTGEKALVIGATTTIFPTPDDITEDKISNADLIHTTGLRVDTTLKAISLAKQRSMLVSLDLEPSTLAQGLDAVRQLLAYTDLLFVNKHALDEIFPSATDQASACAKFLDWGPKMVVLTRGDRGSLVVTPQQTVRTAAFSVPVRDTTGAGDCFNAAFVHGYLRGWTLDRIAIFANAAAAISITAVGAQSALPAQQQVEDFMKSANQLTFDT